MLEIHNKVLDYLLEYKKEHNNFTFATRVNDRNDRLTQGYWFLGNSNYMFVPLFKRGDDANKTKTIGLVYKVDESYIEIPIEMFRGLMQMNLGFIKGLFHFYQQVSRQKQINIDIISL